MNFVHKSVDLLQIIIVTKFAYVYHIMTEQATPKCWKNQHEPVTSDFRSLRTCHLVVANPEHFYADNIATHSKMSGNIGDLTTWMYAK